MNDLILGIPIVVLVPAVVEAAKRAGMPARYAGVAAVVAATALVAMAELARGEGTANDLARWLLAGVVYGLAAVGLWFLEHHWRRALWWYVHLIMPVALRLQKPLALVAGLVVTRAVDEIFLVCRLGGASR